MRWGRGRGGGSGGSVTVVAFSNGSVSYVASACGFHLGIV